MNQPETVTTPNTCRPAPVQRVVRPPRGLPASCPHCGTDIEFDLQGDFSVGLGPKAYCPSCGLDWPITWVGDTPVAVLNDGEV
jgi:uncharacterized protein (DUF983 family)